MNTPLVDMFLLHIPEVFVSKIAVSFSNSWYDVTNGLASAEQLKLMTPFWHAVWLAADVLNCLISGLTGRTIWQAHYVTHEKIIQLLISCCIYLTATAQNNS